MGGGIFCLSSSIENTSVWFAKSLERLKKNTTWSVTTSFHKSYSSFDSLERRNECKELKASLSSQTNIFHRAKNISENATHASYEVAHLIAKHGKPFSDDEFVEECLVKVVGRVIPEKMDDFNNLRLSKQTIMRQIAELSADIHLAFSALLMVSIVQRVEQGKFVVKSGFALPGRCANNNDTTRILFCSLVARTNQTKT